MKTTYFMESLDAAHALIEKAGLLAAEYKDKQPAPGAPIDDYLVIIGDEFYKAPADMVSRALHADAARAKAAINNGIGCVCLAANGKGVSAAAGKDIKPSVISISSEYIDSLKKQAKNPCMLYLAETIEGYAEYLGGFACKDALAAAFKKKDPPAAADSSAWTLLAATARTFNALAQDRPVNVPDVICSTCSCVPDLDNAASGLVEAAYTAATSPISLDDGDITTCANVIEIITHRIVGLLACCDIPGITADGCTVNVEFINDRDGADLSLDEIVYLSKKAQGMAATPEMTTNKDKCIKLHNDNADWYTLAEAIAEYFTAVRNSL